MPRKYALICLIISASIISISAGRQSKSLNNNSANQQLGGAYEDPSLKADDAEETVTVHERLLRVNTHDYGRYDPSPALHKPRYKLIPN